MARAQLEQDGQIDPESLQPTTEVQRLLCAKLPRLHLPGVPLA
jgi:hypothetical protein